MPNALKSYHTGVIRWHTSLERKNDLWDTSLERKMIFCYCHNNCVVPENIHTLPMDGHGKFRGGWEGGVGEGSQRPKFLKESMKLNWNNFQEGWRDSK